MLTLKYRQEHDSSFILYHNQLKEPFHCMQRTLCFLCTLSSVLLLHKGKQIMLMWPFDIKNSWGAIFKWLWKWYSMNTLIRTKLELCWQLVEKKVKVLPLFSKVVTGVTILKLLRIPIITKVACWCNDCCEIS